jgi:hypothetical protein
MEHSISDYRNYRGFFRTLWCRWYRHLDCKSVVCYISDSFYHFAARRLECQTLKKVRANKSQSATDFVVVFKPEAYGSP